MKKNLQWVLLIATSVTLLALAVSRCQNPQEPVVKGAFPLQERWRFEVDREIVAGPGVGEGKVMIRTAKQLYALDVHTGSVLWTTPVPWDTWPTPPLIEDHLVVVGSVRGVKVLNTETGQVVWESSDPSCSDADVIPAAINETMVYVVRYFCDVRAYDRVTGAMVWEVDLPGARSVANLFLDQDRIYLVVTGDILQVLDSVTGRLIEEITGQIGYPAAYQSGILYGFIRSNYGFRSDKDDKLVAFNTRTGERLWVGPAVNVAYPVGPPLVAGQRLLVPTDGYPMAFDIETGKLLWAAKKSRDIYQTPAVLADTVYIRGIGSGKVYALSIQDGSELGHLSTGKQFVITGHSIPWRPVIAEGMLIVPLGRRVYAYGD
jgi:outer membrane protein assembly factor BamB